MTRTSIESWTDLGLAELFYAYRKAKADCFFERSLFLSREFADFEANLPSNLNELLSELRVGEIEKVLIENLGVIRLSEKKLSAKLKKSDNTTSSGHGFFSDPNLAFQNLCETNDLIPEFRLVGEFPVQMHVLSALWINLVGHKFDAVLSKSAFGVRLRGRVPGRGVRGPET